MSRRTGRPSLVAVGALSANDVNGRRGPAALCEVKRPGGDPAGRGNVAYGLMLPSSSDIHTRILCEQIDAQEICKFAVVKSRQDFVFDIQY